MQLNRKTIVYIVAFLVVLILCLAVTIWSSFFRSTQINSQVTKRLTIEGYNNYLYTVDYTLANDSYDLGDSPDNFLYRPKPFDFVKAVREGALKIGLSNEATNVTTGVTTWTKQGVNNLYEDYISLNIKTLSMQVRFMDGLNSTPLEIKDMYTYASNFFGLPSHNAEITSNTKFETSNTITYGVKVMDKSVYFEDADLSFATIASTDGKIRSYFTYLLNNEFDKDFEMQPVKKIEKANFGELYVQGNFQLEELTGGSQLGTEAIFVAPANVGIRKAEHAYIYFNDIKEGRLLIPIFYVSGVFTDRADKRGEANLLVVNQSR